MTVNLPAGTYNLQCPVPGHAAAGMVGVLTVSDDAGAADGGEEAAPDGGTPEAEATPDGGTPEAGGTPEGNGTPAADGAAAGGGTAFDVSMVDLRFEPPDFTIPANTDVTVTVVNNGNLPHYWQIIDQGIETPETQGGDTTPHEVTVNLPAGTYNLQCPVPGHAAAGMVGVLTVQ